MTPLCAHFGVVVRRHREALGWSQEEFADRAGLNRSYGGEVERGSANPSLATVVKVAGAFGVSPSALLAEVESLARQVGGPASSAPSRAEGAAR